MEILLFCTAAAYSTAILLLTLGLRRAVGRFARARDRAAWEGAALPGLAIVVAARNEEEHLPELLRALDAQDYPVGGLTITIVDDGSTDSTPAILESFTPRVHTLNTIRTGTGRADTSPKKYALTTGIEATDSPLLLLTDADTVPPAGWARTMASAMAGGCTVVAGYSPSRPRSGVLGWANMMWDLGNAALAAGFIGLGLPVHAAGRSLGFTRQAFVEAGGYTGLEHALSGDDTLLLQKLSRCSPAKGWGYSFDPGVQVPTRPPSGWIAYLEQRRRHVATGKRFRFPALAAAAGAFLIFALLWAALVTLPWNPWHPAALTALAAKLAVDLIMVRQAVQYSSDRGAIITAPLFSLAHLLVYPLLQLAGTLLPFTWKGRKGI